MGEEKEIITAIRWMQNEVGGMFSTAGNSITVPESALTGLLRERDALRAGIKELKRKLDLVETENVEIKVDLEIVKRGYLRMVDTARYWFERAWKAKAWIKELEVPRA